MNRSELEATARVMVAPGRGILAADRSVEIGRHARVLEVRCHEATGLVGDHREPEAPPAQGLQHHQGLAPPQPVAHRSGEHLRKRVGRLGDAFDDADREGRCAQHDDEKQGQQTVDHLRGSAHEQAHDPERDDVPRQRPLLPARHHATLPTHVMQSSVCAPRRGERWR